MYFIRNLHGPCTIMDDLIFEVLESPKLTNQVPTQSHGSCDGYHTRVIYQQLPDHFVDRNNNVKTIVNRSTVPLTTTITITTYEGNHRTRYLGVLVFLQNDSS